MSKAQKRNFQKTPRKMCRKEKEKTRRIKVTQERMDAISEKGNISEESGLNFSFNPCFRPPDSVLAAWKLITPPPKEDKRAFVY